MKRIFTLGAAALAALVALTISNPGQAQSTWEMNLGSLAPKGTPWTDMLEKIERNVEAGSDGRINVIIRPPGQMGEVEMVRETRRGERLQGCGVTTAAFAEGGNIAQLQVIELPYLFDNITEADHVLDNVVWEPLSELMARRGFVLGIWSENGWRSFGTRHKPIRTPEDLKGFKMRAQESDVHMAMYNTFGAQAVQKPMTEVLTSLQSNVVDGLDQPPLYIKTAGLHEALDYYTLTRIIYQPAAVAYSKRWFDTLPEDLQALVLEQKKLTVEGRVAVREEAAAILDLLREDIEVIELTAEEREAFVAVAHGMHAEFAASVDGTELYNTIDTALKEMRAGN
ncbi:MAG: TRAP transporter substrate-binding protein [Deltaproteobacteria bacterium]|nr:TRAP transporter substrate-binding protein [Deltaproteobacteria bacterium]